jgi:hypothetical protein
MNTGHDRFFNSASPITSRVARSGFWWPFCLDEIDAECAQLVAQLAHRLDRARSDQRYAEHVIEGREATARRFGMPLHMRLREAIINYRRDVEWVEDKERWQHHLNAQLAEVEIEHLTTLIEAAYVA